MGGNEPPKLRAGDVYSSWKRAVRVWQLGATIDTSKQGARVIQALEGKTLDFATRMDLEKVKADDGVTFVLNELDKYFKKDETQIAFVAIENLENYKRTNESISEYIEEFSRRKDLVEECEGIGAGAYKDSILAYRLLKQAQLTQSESQLIRATIGKLSFENMIIAMKKTLGDVVVMEGAGTSNNSDVLPIKQEPAYFEQDEYENQYYGNNFRGSGQFNRGYNSYNKRGRGFSHNGRYNSYNYNNRTHDQRNQYHHKTERKEDLQMNPKDKVTGRTMTCNACNSLYHFEHSCTNRKNKRPVRSYFLECIERENCETIDSAYETIMLIDGVSRRALVDSGCVTSVCGKDWLDDYKKGSSSKIIEEPAKKNFRFGDGPPQESTTIVKLPINLCGKDRVLHAFVISGEIPLLLSRTALSEFEALMDFKNDTICMDGVEQAMHVAATGHYVVDIDRPETIDLVLLSKGEKDPKKAALKLHRYFGHPSSKRLVDLIKDSDLDKEVVKHVKDLDCDTCARFKRERPKPKASLMTSSEFNGVVALDLKQLSTGDIMIHMIDLFTRFSATGMIKDKHQNTIVDAVFNIWICIFGRPKLVYNDNGGEFINESFITVCENLGVEVKSTAANSPFSNGVCERHNGLIGETFDKIMEDVKCNPSIALAWATNAKNSYNNSYGFSPYQLVFGKTPSIPGLDNIRLATELNDSVVSKLIADHLNAMYLSRQAYLKSTQSALVKRAMSDRITFQDEKYFMGDKVYFKRKNLKRWCGPATVIGQDGKIVIVRQGGFNLRVHASRVALRTRADKEIMGEISHPSVNSQQIQQEVQQKQVHTHEVVNNSESEDDEERLLSANSQQSASCGEDLASEEQRTEEPSEDQEVEESSEEPVVTEDPIIEAQSTSASKEWKSISYKNNGVLDLKAGDKIRLKESKGDWEVAVITGPGGTVKGRNKNLFNLVKSKDESSHHCHLDKMEVEKSTDPIMYFEDNTSYVVNIPRDRYNEPAIQEAMNAEMERWKTYGTYREIYDRGQKTISTRWVVTEKKTGYKARLVVRGFEEIDVGQADSPTGDKATLRMVLSLAASENWKLQSIDIKSAYLQAENLDRVVYVRPPKELKKPGLIWQLDKPVYGLIDSARNWYTSISSFLQSLGCKMCIYDKALFYYSINNKLSGLILMHVDDFIFCGSQKFLNEVLRPLKLKYDISKHETDLFKYIGIEIVQDNLGIVLNQNQYIHCVEQVHVKSTRQEEPEENLTKEEQTQYLSLLGKISWLAQITRPDLKYDVYQYAKHNKSATVQNLLDLNGVVSKVFKQHRSMRFLMLDKKKPWKIVVYADASFANIDKVDSARGYIVLLCDGDNACILTWNANKVCRVVTSVLESETLALRDGIRHAELLRTIFNTIKYGSESNEAILPIIAFTDSRQLWTSLHSTKRCKDVALHRDICLLQEKIRDGIVSEVRWISNELQIADCLTKKGVHPKKLAILVETGKWNV